MGRSNRTLEVSKVPPAGPVYPALVTLAGITFLAMTAQPQGSASYDVLFSVCTISVLSSTLLDFPFNRVSDAEDSEKPMQR